MTGPIKPTGGAPVPEPITGRGDVGEASGADFRAALDEPSSETPAPAELSADLARLVAGVEAGGLTPSEALDALVERALSSSMAQGLEPAARAGLEAHLRTALAEDPVLRQMIHDLSRAG